MELPMHWCFVLTFALTSSAWAASTKSVYLLSPEAPDPTLAKTLLEAMAAELGKQQAYRVITDEDVKSVLQVDQTKQLMGCAADRECAAKIQEQTKADLLLATSVGRVGRSLI